MFKFLTIRIGGQSQLDDFRYKGGKETRKPSK